MPRIAREARAILQCSPPELLLHFYIERTGGGGIPAPLRKIGHFPDPNAAIQGDRQHIARLQRVSGGHDADAVDADMALGDQIGGARSGSDDPRVPEPFVDSLAIHEVKALPVSP